MKALTIVLYSCLCALLLSACASINYNEIAPNAKDFRPRDAVILPAIKMPEGADQEVDKAAKAIYDAATATKRFKRVIDPITAKSQMRENSQLQEAILTYTSKLRSLGISDQESSRKIGEIYGVDTIIVADVSQWSYVTGGEKEAEVGMAIKMAGAATGTVYWKAAHTIRKSYWLFKPNLEEMAADVAEKIFDFMP